MTVRTTVLNTLFYSFLILMTGCKSQQPAVDSNRQEPAESISLSVNEMLQFEFQKFDTSWTGTLTVYSWGENDQKVVDRKFVAANDSSWQDFDMFVDFLKLYEIGPQHEIEGWAPNSGKLPSKVYSFEVFDGDTTKTYSYQDPIDDVNDYWQSQNILTFITFVENDLRWQEQENVE